MQDESCSPASSTPRNLRPELRLHTRDARSSPVHSIWCTGVHLRHRRWSRHAGCNVQATCYCSGVHYRRWCTVLQPLRCPTHRIRWQVAIFTEVHNHLLITLFVVRSFATSGCAFGRDPGTFRARANSGTVRNLHVRQR